MNSIQRRRMLVGVAIAALAVGTLPINPGHAAAAQVFVDDHGAVAGDTADDGPAIRRAVEAARALGPGTEVVFSGGTYVVEPPARSWSFSTDGDLEGWTPRDANVTVEGGVMTVTPTTTDPRLESENHLTIDTAQHSLITIRMKNNTSASTGTVYWAGVTDSGFSETRKVSFDIIPNDSAFTDYTVDLSTHPDWTGFVRQIRIDPENGVVAGTVEIDWVELALRDGKTLANPNYHLYFPELNGITFTGSQAGVTEVNFSDPLSGGLSFPFSTDVAVKNLTLDWATPPWAQGTLTAVDTTAGTFDIQVASGYDVLDDPRAAEIPRLWGAPREPGNPHLMKKTARDFFDVLSFQKLNATTYRMTVTASMKASLEQLQVNDPMVINIRGLNARALTFRSSSGATINDVTVYASPSMVVTADRSSVNVDALKILRRPGSTRWIAANADGVHAQSPRQALMITNSTFEGLLDDGIHIYDRPGAINSIISSTQVDVTKSSMPIVNDLIQVFDPANGIVRGTASVAAVTPLAANSFGEIIRAELTFSAPIAGMTPSDSPYNLSTVGQGTIVQNNTFRHSRRHGVFIKSRNATIDSNSFIDLSGAAVVVENEPDSPNGPFATTTAITNNDMNTVAYPGASGASGRGGAIRVSSLRLGFQPAEERGHYDTLIENNTIHHPPRYAIYIGGAERVRLLSNTIQAYAEDPVYDGNIAGVRVNNAAHVTVDGLTMSDPRAALNAGIEIGTSPFNINAANLNFTLAPGVPEVAWLYNQVPTGLTAVAGAGGQVSLDWADNPDVGSTLSHYRVYRSTTFGFTSSIHNRIATNLTSSSYVDTTAAAGTTYYYRVTAVSTSGIESTPTAQVASRDTIVDTSSSSPQYQESGTWLASGLTGYGGGPTRYSSLLNGGETATWTPNLGWAGSYKVYVWVPSHPNTTTEANYVVTHNAGSTTYVVNQQADGGRWRLLGTHQFTAGTLGSVTLSIEAEGNHRADAVLFRPA